MEMVVLKKLFGNDKENGCRFEGQWKDTWIYTWPARLIAGRERKLDFIQTKLHNSLALALDVILVLDSRNYLILLR